MKFGVWQATLPILYENRKFKLPFANLPKLKNQSLKTLINNSLSDWQNIPDKDELIKRIKSDSWFFDEANKAFVLPSSVFLFNDLRPRKCISQEKRMDGYEDFYHFLNIDTIEDTKDIKKLTSQLELMKGLEVDENHKTVYKQLILCISRLKNEQIKEIPMLLTNGSYTMESCWFVPYDQRKYVHYFSDYNFINFDINTPSGFIINLNHVRPFEPEFIIKSTNDQLIKDNGIKQFFESSYLSDFFSLAEVVLSTSLFDKEEVMKRWNNFEIFKGEDVWLEVSFANRTFNLFKDQKREVLFKPVSRSEREKKKELVGLLAYDIDNYASNQDLSKFGFAIAETIFRNQNLGDIFANYIEKKQRDLQSAMDYLGERGIGEKELNQNKKFIELSLVNIEEMNDFLQAINVNECELNIDNWTDRFYYTGLSFQKLRDIVIENLKCVYPSTSKFESLLELINPFESNMKFIYAKQDYLQVCYYASFNKVLTKDEFDKIVKVNSNVEDFFCFDFDIDQCFSILSIRSDLDIATFEKAKAELSIIDILKEIGYTEKLEFTPIVSNGIKTQTISAVGKSETHTSKKTYDDREGVNRMRHKRGIGIEKILALKYAQDLFQNNQIENLKDHIHQITELKDLEISNSIENIETLANLLQVSKSMGDGLGYDLLEPVFDEGKKLKRFNRVEIKSSKSDPVIYLSENERLKILHFAEQKAKDWRLYHFVENKTFDRTQSVYDAVTCHAANYNGDQLLVAENWFISFTNS